MRIVSLTCSNTEIVCALGCEDYLVGVDDHSDFPEDVVARCARVGPDLTVDIDAIAALKPDMVLASLTVPGHEHNIAALQAAGLPYVVTEPKSLTDIEQDILTIGACLGVSDRANHLVQQLKPQLAPTVRPSTDFKPRILIQWWPKPVIAPGNNSWAHDLIEAAGGINALGHDDCESRPMTDEEVAALNPDVIVIAWCGVKLEKYRPDVVYRNPVFSTVTAIQKQQVFCISEAFLGRPSPRLVSGLEQLKAIVQQI
jgi:iron complex transport system substrate-binding protein